MQNVLKHVSVSLSHLAGKCIKKFQHSLCGSCHTVLSYGIFPDVFVLVSFACAKVEVIWYGNLVSDQSLVLLHILRISYVSESTFGLSLK